MPESGSTCTSATAALYEYAGEGPTPLPRYRPAPAGGVYDPTVPIVPRAASAAWTASAKVVPVSGFSASNTRDSAKTRRLVGTSSCLATSGAIKSRARSAARRAALPDMSVTRLE